MREIRYKVTYACASLDPNPIVKEFDSFDEMQDWIIEERDARIQFQVEHSPYSVSESELEELEELESALIRIEELPA